MSADRFELLETKMLYQEDTIQKLDDALIDQQKQILNLQLQLKDMHVQLKAMENLSPENSTPQDELPPHY